MLAAKRRLPTAAAWLTLSIALMMPSFCRAQEGYTPVPVIKGIELLKGGAKAPTFKVKLLDGNTFDFTQEIGKQHYLFVFWSIYCEPCREEMPMVEKFFNQYKSKGLQIMTVNLDGEPFLDAVRGFIKQGKYTFPVLMDELQGEVFVIADPYNVAGTPVMYFINKKGEIAFNILGRVTEEELKSRLEEAMTAP